MRERAGAGAAVVIMSPGLKRNDRSRGLDISKGWCAAPPSRSSCSGRCTIERAAEEDEDVETQVLRRYCTAVRAFARRRRICAVRLQPGES
jgi:hypothetical protein